MPTRRLRARQLAMEWDHDEWHVANPDRYAGPADIWTYHQPAVVPVDPWHRMAARIRTAAIRADLRRWLAQVDR